VPDLREALAERVLILDGGLGTTLSSTPLGRELIASGRRSSLDLWCLEHPETVREVHESFLRVGCDLVETNTFQASPLALADYGIADRARALNEAGARIARAACDAHSTPHSPRFALGAIGPGTRLPTLGQVDRDTLEAGYCLQAESLIDGGVDGLMIETCQDPLQIDAAIAGVASARESRGSDLPIFVSITVEITGTLLVGTKLREVVERLATAPIDLLGLNCATGPREMSDSVRELAALTPFPLGVYPNAGLPEIVDGVPRYALTPSELADWLLRFVEEDGAALVGGCCGTTPEHMAATVRAIGRRRPASRARKLPARRTLQAPTIPTVDVPRAPFRGPRRVELIPLRNVLPYMDEHRLFCFHWDLPRKGRGAKEHESWLEREVRPRYLELVNQYEAEQVLAPSAIYGFWPARVSGDALQVFDESRREVLMSLEPPRQQDRKHLCVCDYISQDEGDELALFALTLGPALAPKVRQLFREGREVESRELEGLGVELLRATAEHVHRQLRGEWGIAHDDARDTRQLLAKAYRGCRYEFGVAPLPGLDGRRQALELLGTHRIGLTADNDELAPEASAVFLVSHHPQAQYFHL
jgi:methionine synthase I (cobalamin-dependent)